MNMKRFLGAMLLAALAGCNVPVPKVITPYRMEIQQGNFITQDMLSQLKPGMTRDQVKFILGTPLLVDPFHTDRWDYVFLRSPENSEQVEQRRITVFFSGEGLLQRVSGDVVAAGAAPKPAAQAAPQEKK